MHGLEIVSKLTHWRGVDMLKLVGFTNGKLQDNMQFDIIAIRNLQISYSHFIAECKLFSCGSKPIHALLAS